MKPALVPVVGRIRESGDVVTLQLETDSGESGAPVFQPGQFNMLYAFGVGEVAISISSDPDCPERLEHTIRAVGPVSAALNRLAIGEQLGVRGPFGSSWPVQAARSSDLLLVAGGIGLAPLRPALYHALRHRDQYRRVALIYGARSPADLLFRGELERWRRRADLRVRVTVDRAGADWAGDVGLVTHQFSRVEFDPHNVQVMICGPEIMIRASVSELLDAGVTPRQMHVSMERNMKCAVGLCGHCQFGPKFVCRDGPVFRLDQVENLLTVREI